MLTTRRLSRLAVVAGATCALITGGIVVAGSANAATPTSAATSSAPAATAPAKGSSATKPAFPFRMLRPAGLHRLVGDLPSALKSDLKALKGEKGSARRAAGAAIETKALAGGYGSAIKDIAASAQAAYRSAPASLKTDLKALKGESRTERTASLAKVEAKALAGGYGSAVESYAKKLQSMAAAHAAETAAPVLGSMV